jgi:hypothetical protein
MVFSCGLDAAGGKRETARCLRNIGLRGKPGNCGYSGSNMEFRGARTTRAARLEGDLLPMRAAFLILKRSLFGLVGVMALAAVSFSATVPRLLWLMEQEGACPASECSIKTAPRNSIVGVHTPRSQAARGLRPMPSKPVKTKNSIDRPPPQATLALTRCKDHAPTDGAPAVAGGKSTSRKPYTNSIQEKSLCNPESLRSR